MATVRFTDPAFPIDPDDLPAAWIVTTVGEVVSDIRPGFASGQHNDEGRGIPHLRPMNIDRRGRVTLQNLKFVLPTSDLRVVAGDVLFNNTNSRELVGKTAPFEFEGEWAFSNHMTRLRPPPGVSYRFLAYQLHFLWEEGYFRLRAKQHVNQASISATTLARSVPLVLATEQDQLRIVVALDENLDRLETAATALSSARAKLAEYRRRVIIQAASGTLVPTEADLARSEGRDFESGAELLDRIHQDGADSQEQTRSSGQRGSATLPLPGLTSNPSDRTPLESAEFPPLPDGWTWARMNQVGGVTLGRQRAPRYHHGPYMRPYLRVANVLEDKIDVSDIHEMNFTPEEYETYALRRNDILLNEGQSPELVGRPAMFNDEVPGACFQKTLIRFRAHPGVSPAFALLVFRSNLHTGRFTREARWSTNIAHLGWERFANMEFPLPPLAEQERIATEARRCLDAADELEAAIEGIEARITDIRRLALALAFTGRLAEQAPSDGSAASLLQSINRLRDARPPRPRTSTRRATATGASAMDPKPLTQVLREYGSRLTPEELLQQSAIGEERIDEFYAELKREVTAGAIRQEVEQGNVYLVLIGSQS